MNEMLKQDVLDDDKLEWLEPSIDDFDIEEVTRSGLSGSYDGTTYS